MPRRQVAAPETVRKACDFESIDYEDAFEVYCVGSDTYTAEDWARDIFLEAPAAVRAFLNKAWSAAGLKSRSESFESMLKSRVANKSPNIFVLKTYSKLGMDVRVVVYVHESNVGLATFMRFDKFIGRWVWASMAPVHRRIAPYLLAHAIGRRGKSAVT
jgi:hypothetical protein